MPTVTANMVILVGICSTVAVLIYYFGLLISANLHYQNLFFQYLVINVKVINNLNFLIMTLEENERMSQKVSRQYIKYMHFNLVSTISIHGARRLASGPNPFAAFCIVVSTCCYSGQALSCPSIKPMLR